MEQDGTSILRNLNRSLFTEVVRPEAVRLSDVTIYGNNQVVDSSTKGNKQVAVSTAKGNDQVMDSSMKGEGASTPMLFGLTVNLKPNCKMNNKTWKTYLPEQQLNILRRVMDSYLKKTPSVKLIERHFETCPTLGNIHFHALISCPLVFVTDVICYWEKYSGNLPDTVKPWRCAQYEPIYDVDGWLQYIRKDLKTD